LPRLDFKVTGVATQALNDDIKLRLTTPCGTVLPEMTATWDDPTDTSWFRLAVPPGTLPMACVWRETTVTTGSGRRATTTTTYKWTRWTGSTALTLGATEYWPGQQIDATTPAKSSTTANSQCTS
jgi:hypothetical protein